MLLVIEQVLDAHGLAQVRAQIAEDKFVDGRASAGAQARRAKYNEELASTASHAHTLNTKIVAPLHAHARFQAAAFPHKLSGAHIARYRTGMHYGSHTDDPIMGSVGGRYRADIAVTVMLSERNEYDGGDLTIDTAYGAQRVSLQAGSAVLYPASSVHSVAHVTRGERLVAVAWCQSSIRSAERRQLLFDLWNVRESLLHALPDAKVSVESERIYASLVRMWAEL
jgi:PKHD-type hydroxylase